ncbi:hypothetical protein [Pseudorhodoplanes sp.]|uniref:hypothetical protein n=1 Tax=Pseudorhodoplanes sp. TaxID=1934341 RepID=UPI00391A551F
MRSLLMSCSALALIATVAPASAMCGGMGQQGQSTGQSAAMCGRPSASSQAEDPFGMKVQPQQSQRGGMMMRPCCRGMAMMHGGGQSDDPHKDMDMSPKAQ